MAAPKVLADNAEMRALVDNARRDPSKFGELYEMYFELVYAYIVRRVRHRDTAEDLTSEVFHKALANLENFEWRGAPFGAWLIRIAANAVADHLKRDARDHAKCSTTEPSTEPDMQAIEHRAQLFRLVNDLPDDQRRVIYGRFVDERSIRDMALEFGRSEGAIKQLQFRAVENLRARMEGGHA
jgi:RNA polymerase sigma-70 factor, ECF subfamily